MWVQCLRLRVGAVFVTQTRRYVSTSSQVGTVTREQRSWWKWFGIPASLGVTCLALLQLQRTLRRENRLAPSREPDTWQLALFRLLPARVLSRTWGYVMEKELPHWLRRPLLGLYVWTFGCNMEEAELEDLREYRSFMALFTRDLKEGARTISPEYPLVCPADGKVLHFGRVEGGHVEQVKGVTYQLDKFLGPGTEEKKMLEKSLVAGDTVEQHQEVSTAVNETTLYHIILYLAPGDCHHFHSPVEWTLQMRRHFPGELLTVAPWAARTMPGLFALNERAVLTGYWEHGFFSYTAVGAYNVGSIRLTVDKELTTNQKGRFKMGHYSEKWLGTDERGLALRKGDKLGCFGMGSSIVLIFEAPNNFQFVVELGEKVLCGQPLGVVGASQINKSNS